MTTGRITSINYSMRKGQPKESIRRATLVEDHGLKGDVHAGPGKRQVSLLAIERFKEIEGHGIHLRPGLFAENITTEGIDLSAVAVGDRVALGASAVLEVTLIGKTCHAPCEIGRTVGRCIMPDYGVFTRVASGGDIAVGDVVTLIERAAAAAPRQCEDHPYTGAVLVASDRCAAGTAEDRSGKVLKELLEGHGVSVVAFAILPDDRDALQAFMRRCIEDLSVNFLFTTGGTGIGPRDVTPEATRELLTCELPGIAEAIRAFSVLSVPTAVLSRGLAGMAGGTLVVNLPGSVGGVKDGFKVVGPILEHVHHMLSGKGH